MNMFILCANFLRFDFRSYKSRRQICLRTDPASSVLRSDSGEKRGFTHITNRTDCTLTFERHLQWGNNPSSGLIMTSSNAGLRSSEPWRQRVGVGRWAPSRSHTTKWRSRRYNQIRLREIERDTGKGSELGCYLGYTVDVWTCIIYN